MREIRVKDLNVEKLVFIMNANKDSRFVINNETKKHFEEKAALVDVKGVMDFVSSYNDYSIVTSVQVRQREDGLYDIESVVCNDFKFYLAFVMPNKIVEITAVAD